MIAFHFLVSAVDGLWRKVVQGQIKAQFDDFLYLLYVLASDDDELSSI